jgi:hypothetical protein
LRFLAPSLEGERTLGKMSCRELGATVQESWESAKWCMQACRKFRCVTLCSTADFDGDAVGDNLRCPGPVVAALRA